MSKKMGRPPILGNAVTMTFRLSREQFKAIGRASKKKNRRKSEWIREVLVEAAQV